MDTDTVVPVKEHPVASTGRRRSAMCARPLTLLTRMFGVLVVLVAGLVSGIALPATGAVAGPPSGTAAAQPSGLTAVQPAGSSSVVLVGVAGLSWTDVTPEDMPALYELTGSRSVASLTVRSVRSRTCTVDGWLTVGAGRRATDLLDSDGDEVDDRFCRPAPDPEGGGDSGWAIPGWGALVAEQEEQAYNTELGLLGRRLTEAGVCSTAIGPGAALALADGIGHVSSYGAAPAEVDAEIMSRCPVTVIDAGALPPPAPAGSDEPVEEAALEIRRQVAAGIDKLIQGIRDQLPDSTALLVAGIADSAPTAAPLPDEPTPIETSALRVAVAMGPKADGGEFGSQWLTSSSTRWSGLVQLTDLASTILAYTDLAVPSDGTVGRPWQTGGGHPGSSAETIEQLVGTDRAAQVFRTQSGPFFQILGVAQVIFFGGALVLLRRRSPHRRRILKAVEIVALGAASFPVASYLANLSRWWRHDRADIVLWSTLLALTLVITALALAGPWRRRVYGAPGVIAGLTAAVLAVDVSTGSNLQHSSLLGLSPLVAGRFYGFGNIPYAIFVASALVAAAALAQWLRDSGRSPKASAVAVAIVGGVAVVIDGHPQAGADVGGILATIPGFVVLFLGVLGARVTVARIALAGAAAAVVFAVVAWLDWLRPPAVRTHFGDFFADALSGDAWTVMFRKALASLGTLQRSPYYGWLVPVGYAVIIWAVRKPVSGFRDATTRWAALPHLVWAGLLTGAVGFAVNDSGIIVPALLLTIGIPLVVSAVAAARRAAVTHDAAEPVEQAAHPG